MRPIHLQVRNGDQIWCASLIVPEHERMLTQRSLARRAVIGFFSGHSADIARFKKEFETLRKNMDTGAIISATEGITEVQAGMQIVKESITNAQCDGKALHLLNRAFSHCSLAYLRPCAYTHGVDKLQYAKGATWDPNKVCLPSTRIALLDEIMEWAHSNPGSNAAQIFCVTGVAGSGKSAIAHTVAKRCHDQDFLLSSFFFDRNIDERSNPKLLFSTIAHGLARNPRILQSISRAVKDDQGLPSASMSRQFKSLILDPVQQNPTTLSNVIVIDALDEGCSDPRDRDELFKILCNEVPKLPSNFRIFVTARDSLDIHSLLSRAPHVRWKSINTRERTNLDDVTRYVKRELRRVTERHTLGDGWPGPQRTNQLAEKAEGLFLWVATVTGFLREKQNPDGKLDKILSNDLRVGLSAQAKMDELYTTILESWDWDDDDFVDGYKRVMGTTMAAKEPLSVSTIELLYACEPSLPLGDIVSSLGALLTGGTKPNDPIQLLHLSLRDFLTDPSRCDPQFYIDEDECNHKLALMCLTIQNRRLNEDTPGVGYLTPEQTRAQGIPKILKGFVPEEVSYACRFWIDHIVDVKSSNPSDIVAQLRTFLSTKAVFWIEVATAIDGFQRLSPIRDWILVRGPTFSANIHS